MGGLHLQYLRHLTSDYSLDASYGVTAQSNIYSKIGLRGFGEKTAGYAVHDASIGLSKKSKWSASFFVENLTNKYAYTGVDRDSSFQQTFSGFVTRQYLHSVMRPREIGVDFRVNY